MAFAQQPLYRYIVYTRAKEDRIALPRAGEHPVISGLEDICGPSSGHDVKTWTGLLKLLPQFT